MDRISEYWWLIVLVIVALPLLFLLLRPRQRVKLTDSAPVRPHMTTTSKPSEGRGIAGEIAAAASDFTGEIFGAPAHRKLEDGVSSSDDLLLLKGIGPKLAETLHGLGFHRFDQLASLSPAEIERLDNQLGAFRGRLTRDRIVEQADYLARNDIDGFEQKFGKL